ncbi:NLI interacting factor-like phosphatase family protein, putative [Ichthyophthirius multifiliis]|uniref:NLI interacting factor-like phosphatase family protein, putative n=1 Tax=Ichthyophthirius multifiliis TaxID=5932 RepID=G0QQL7_ICHMU|nr:NLI interacting factor-like phosphatase family protein, putative [Ichthyophthirius multifiliis]EGR32484.1 NLI interacting factor-like phosphatase family protein, putative [Ichthyophthirius multifiliis]|eukprot:XP_004036470.1 NLI interacting factor-like phosphatase family protein, putative [Ichthyophthirius multifiliis]
MKDVLDWIQKVVEEKDDVKETFASQRVPKYRKYSRKIVGNTFEKEIKNNLKNQALFFYANNCSACASYGPLYEELGLYCPYYANSPVFAFFKGQCKDIPYIYRSNVAYKGFINDFIEISAKFQIVDENLVSDKILVPPAKMEGLIGYYSFDDKNNLDISGNSNHPNEGSDIQKGQPWGGQGNSLFFNGKNYLSINIPQEQLKSSSYTIQFYYFPVEEKQLKGKKECPIIQKGFDNLIEGKFERQPGIYFNKEKRSIKIFISTLDTNEFLEGNILESNARLSYNKWAHISLSKSSQKIKLYINGILDQVAVLQSFDVENDSPFYIGNTPWFSDDCILNAFVDELKIYNYEIKSYQVQAEASMFLGGIEPSFLHLGCINCELETAKQSCIQGYHLCTSLEIYSGAYNVARIMGWIEHNNNIWSYNQLFQIDNQEDSGSANSGIGICCVDLQDIMQS